MGHELRIGRWTFDPASGELRGEGGTRRLEPRVAQVLEFLASRPGEIVSRNDLLAGVWRDAHVVDAAVWRAVSELRRALGDTGEGVRFIETVPRRGYRMIAPVRPARPPRRVGGAATAALALLGVSLAVLAGSWWAGGRSGTLLAHIGAVPASAPDLYETGLRYYRRYRPDDNRLARSFFVQALSVDPGFAPARAGLADSLTLDFSRFDGGVHAIDHAVDQARRAVRADPASAEAHKALGFAYQARGWLAAGAAASRRAIELAPGFAEAIHNYAGALDEMGRPIESLRWRLRQPLENTDRALLFVGIGHTLAAVGDPATARRYLELALVAEPYSRWASFELAQLEIRGGAAREAHRRLTAALAHHPDCGECHRLLGDADRALGRPEEARAHDRDGLSAFGGAGDAEAAIRVAAEQLASGDRAAADRLLERIAAAAQRRIDAGDERHEPRLRLARVEALRGRTQRALERLREAIDHGLYDASVLEHEAAFADLRRLPEFARLLSDLRSRADRAREAASGLIG